MSRPLCKYAQALPIHQARRQRTRGTKDGDFTQVFTFQNYVTPRNGCHSQPVLSTPLTALVVLIDLIATLRLSSLSQRRQAGQWVRACRLAFVGFTERCSLLSCSRRCVLLPR